MLPAAPSVRAPLRWSDDLLLGDPAIDREHEELLRLIVALQQASDAALPSALAAVADHARTHFAAEDAAMQLTGFPPRACHADEHAAVLASVGAVQQRLADGDVAVVRGLAAELQRWFPGHLQHLDSALAHWLCKQRTGGKPVVLRRRLNLAHDAAD